MALYFSTGDPSALLEAFTDHIRAGRIKTWAIDDDGDFTHTARQWETQAWLCPRLEERRLALYILNPAGRWISTAVYAVYHGRFIESMLTHCDRLFDKALATSIPEEKDTIGPPRQT
jgi:hypothetical protein